MGVGGGNFSGSGSGNGRPVSSSGSVSGSGSGSSCSSSSGSGSGSGSGSSSSSSSSRSSGLFQKLSSSNHNLNFLNDHDHLLGRKFETFFCFLFPVSDHPVWSRKVVRKRLLEGHSISVFNSVDQACWQTIAADFQKQCL